MNGTCGRMKLPFNLAVPRIEPRWCSEWLSCCGTYLWQKHILSFNTHAYHAYCLLQLSDYVIIVHICLLAMLLIMYGSPIGPDHRRKIFWNNLNKENVRKSDFAFKRYFANYQNNLEKKIFKKHNCFILHFNWIVKKKQKSLRNAKLLLWFGPIN